MKKNFNNRWLWFYRFKLSNFFKKKKFHVDTIDNFQRYGSRLNLKDNKRHNIRNFQKDLSKFEDLKKLPKYDIIIDCCAEPSVEASKYELDRVIDTNFLGTYNILKNVLEINQN